MDKLDDILFDTTLMLSVMPVGEERCDRAEASLVLCRVVHEEEGVFLAAEVVIVVRILFAVERARVNVEIRLRVTKFQLYSKVNRALFAPAKGMSVHVSVKKHGWAGSYLIWRCSNDRAFSQA